MNKNLFKNLVWNSFSICFYIIFYYYKLIKNKLNDWYQGKFINYEDKSFSLEMKSLIFAFLFAFFFYYFIVIELSILIFGYSLLCYWFLFLFLFINLIISWRLEVFFLKNMLTDEEKRFTGPESWLFYYDGSTPYSLYDYLTNYKKKPMFKHIIIESNFEDVEKGWFLMNTYLILFSIAFIYFCSYRFWPQYVNFVSNYFHPSVNFFEIRGEPRLKDFYSVIIRFWNRFVFGMEYLYENNPIVYNLIWKIPKASPKWEAKSDWIWLNKISLRKKAGYGDIFFLWALKNNIALQPLIFDTEQPTELCDWFDPNVPLFFLRFMRGQLDNPNNTFWKKYFLKDKHMWDYISNIKENVDVKFDEMDEWTPIMYFDEEAIIPSSFDSLLSENYFDNKLLISKKDLFEYGGYWEFYDNLINSNSWEYLTDFNVLEQGFIRGITYKDNQTYFGLWNHHKITKDKFEKLKKKNQFWTRLLNMFKLFKSNNFTKQDFINITTNSNADINLYRYKDFASYMELDNLDFEEFDLLKKKDLDKYLKNLDWRLTVLEEKCGLTSSSFTIKDYNLINWTQLSTIILRWIWWLDSFYNNWAYYRIIKNYFPSYYEIAAYFKFSFKPSWRMWKIYRRIQKNQKESDLYKTPKAEALLQLSQLEKIIWSFEEKVGLRQSKLNDYSTLTTTNFFEKKFQPWYIWSLKYFDSWDIWVSFPGFDRFYYPTPYPTTFSTFGFNWFWYQIYNLKKNIKNNYVTESISYVGDKSTTPTVLYTGVEAIMYAKPILKIFDIIANFIIWLFSYPIEFFATKWPMLFDNLSLIVFLVHLNWFLHFYIYLFLFLYVFYYFAKFYYYQSSYMWIYEKMFETGFATQTNSLIYWHTLNDIWLNYRTPHQFAILSLQTSLFLFYSFNNLLKFSVNTKYGHQNFLHFLSLFYVESNKIINYFKYNNDKLLCYNNLLTLDNFKYFKYFHKLNYTKYTFLLYEGGSDCNLETLVWNYYDYLTQTSNFLSKSLVKNHFFFNKNDYLQSLIKQFTILISSQSLTSNFLFLSSPILDVSLSRKLFIELFDYVELECLYDENFFTKMFSFDEKTKPLIFTYVQLINLWFNFINNNTNSIEDLYKIFGSKNFSFLSKFDYTNSWNSKEYWILAFFWSFWFVKKTQYPYINFPRLHEVNWLNLRWAAYSNSWIGSTINVRPFYNLIQHIWWTSRAYSPAFSLSDHYLNFNGVGLNGLDIVWNFLEKRYSNYAKKKTETLFGIVTTLEFVFGKEWYNWLKNFEKSKLNYDLSYPLDSIENLTTNRLYDKTNPPLNLLEIGVTPSRIFKIFQNFYPANLFLYLTFTEQIDFINNKINIPTNWNLKKDYSEVEFVNTYINVRNPKTIAKFDFYLKKFDNNLKFNKQNELSNWLFTFDTSFFFNHFLSWDYFNMNHEDLVYKTKKSDFFCFIKNKSFAEINSIYTSAEHWFDKPFGALDKLELNLMQRFKDIKDMDYLSYTNNRENPFLFLEKENFKNISGLSTLGLHDDRTSSDSYEEDYIGQRSHWYLFSNSTIFSSPSPLILGWVGDIYNSTIDATSMLFSILYSSADLNPLAFQQKKKLFHLYDFYNYKKYFYNTYFDMNETRQKIYAKSFSWLNLSLYPTSFRNFFGMKCLTKLDFWSWKCGLQIDYKNGFYNYWPYLGLWHSFGNWLTVFDPIYGFYWSYRQIEDDPTIIDLETDAIEWLFEDQEDSAYVDWDPETGFKDAYDLNDEDDWWILRSLSTRYREVYFSFHHPYFLGYFLFWFFSLLLQEQYLGVANFSFKRLIAWNFYKNFNYYDSGFESDFSTFLLERGEIENWYRKYMFKYWTYFLNSIKLSTNFSNLIEWETNLSYSFEDHIITTFDDLTTNLNFLNKFSNQSSFDLINFLDFKKINFQLFNINWYNLDMPFPLNPFLPINPILWNSSKINYLSIYNNYFLTYSHYDSLWENINFGNFYDSYIGSYLDSFNFISYYSAYRSNTTLPNHVLDWPDYLATHHLWFSFDRSKTMAQGIISVEEFYDNHDSVVGYGLVLQNLSFIRFFSSTLILLLNNSLTLREYNVIQKFLEFYFKGFSFYSEFIQLKWKNISSEDKIFSPIIYPLSSVFSTYKHSFFLSNILRYLPHDLLMIWLDLGYTSISRKQLKNIFKFKKISLTDNILNIKIFYDWIGYILTNLLFKK